MEDSVINKLDSNIIAKLNKRSKDNRKRMSKNIKITSESISDEFLIQYGKDKDSSYKRIRNKMVGSPWSKWEKI